MHFTANGESEYDRCDGFIRGLEVWVRFTAAPPVRHSSHRAGSHDALLRTSYTSLVIQLTTSHFVIL
ncbi:unnamed protein product [Euphydryas editha]|uniref:Uncharacterized protein n=1 Tax=Euphydryas editha TaxID=104508 RepID=A0AAU9VD94_EUPED|nr:unnamed protein product [Euphydryas editha]